MEIWFDTVPRELWYGMDGHPLVAFWSIHPAAFTHQQGNPSALLRWLRARFHERYGAALRAGAGAKLMLLRA